MFRFRFLLIVGFAFSLVSISVRGQAPAKAETSSVTLGPDSDADRVEERAKWFWQGREARRGQAAAEMRRRAFAEKLQLRVARAARESTGQAPGAGVWIPLGPVPLASDATGSGLQDYRQVSGRATAVAIDPADPTGNTIFIGGAQGGVWKSNNAADPLPNNVVWTPLTDAAPTLATGAIAIQPGNTDPFKSVLIVATGEANNSGDSYFGLGMMRSMDGGASWMNVPTASSSSGTVSFSGLGGTRIAFSTAAGQTSTVVAAMATSAEGELDGAFTAATVRGLYTSTDAGLSWSYITLVDPSGQTNPDSATSVVYNAAAGLFFSAVRYHGFYSSPDGLTWTRLANQPGAPGVLSTAACPPVSSTACAIYRGEITTVPGRNEMYVWFVSVDSSAKTVLDQGIWNSTDGGAQWTQISNAGIANCGDPAGCGVNQGTYNLELLAVPNGASATDLYAGGINVYKCSISSINPTCSSSPFLNLTHVYGCPILGEPAHVHPDQHAMAYILPGSGSALMYFANDGGIYRALDGYTGLTTGSCAEANQFDDLNQNLGPMTQFVALSQHPNDANTLLGGTQDNGSPATSAATTSSNWTNVLGGDGGYNAIDPNSPSDWFASNPDGGGGRLQIYQCPLGISCHDNSFQAVVTSASVGGDDGPFYPFYALDPQSTTSMLVGTCRVWRGPRLGGVFTVLSPNLDTLGSGTCTGDEPNTVRAIAVGGPTDANGSQVVYVTTNGLGPNFGVASGEIWVSTQASNGPASFSNVTGGINPGFFPLSSVAIDNSDATGLTAFTSVMGFTGSGGHVWKTTSASFPWTDFSGSGASALPDSPVNALLVDSATHTIYAGTDVGVFQSSSVAAGWTEVGPVIGVGGFLPNVVVTGLSLFDSGGQKLLRAATYGRGIWQFNIFATPNFQVAVPNSSQIIFGTQTAIFPSTLTSFNGYNNLVNLSCTNGSTAPPASCTVAPSTITPTPTGTQSVLSTSGAPGDYNFNLHAAGTDPNNVAHDSALTLHIFAFGLTAPSPTSVTIPRGTSSGPVNFQATAAGSFNQLVTVTCQIPGTLAGATCTLTPQAVVSPTANSPVNMTATISIPASAPTGTYTVTLLANTAHAPAPASVSFSVVVTKNSDFILVEPTPFPNVKFGSTGTTGPINISSLDGFSGTVALDCSATFGAGSCSLSPSSVNTFPATVTLTINGAVFSPGSYALTLTGTSGSLLHNLSVPFDVSTYSLTGPASLLSTPGAQATANLTLTSKYLYNGQINATCDASSLSGAQCSLSPSNPISLSSGSTTSLTATINVPNNAASGTYNVNINSQDNLGAPLVNLSIPLTIGQDYTIGTISPASPSITAGGSASYNFSVIPIGASYNGSILLKCFVAPVFLGNCGFDKTTVTPGTSSVNVVMTLATIASTASSQPPRTGSAPWLYALWLVIPGIILQGLGSNGTQRRKRMAISGLLLGLAASGVSCGGGSNGSGQKQQGTSPGTYTITVVGVPASSVQPNGSATSLIVN